MAVEALHSILVEIYGDDRAGGGQHVEIAGPAGSRRQDATPAVGGYEDRPPRALVEQPDDAAPRRGERGAAVPRLDLPAEKEVENVLVGGLVHDESVGERLRARTETVGDHGRSAAR